jgi:ABC-2 type transport system ATP-binding protein
MADNVIVIGKGKLIASTSIKNLVSSNTKSSVFVRTDNLNKLQSILKEKSLTYVAVDGGLEITGVKVDEVGKLAHQANILILELTTKNASLEDVFLELTEGSEEFLAHKSKGDKS